MRAENSTIKTGAESNLGFLFSSKLIQLELISGIPKLKSRLNVLYEVEEKRNKKIFWQAMTI